jgi:hypothetical protein
MKVLVFRCRGTWYEASLEPDTLGQVKRYGYHEWGVPHPSWRILGVSKHHMQNHVTVPLTPDIDPKTLIKGYVFDVDHGTTRRWGGGGEIRITDAYVKEAP